MKRVARVFRNSIIVGILTEDENQKYRFEYDALYFNNDRSPAVSLTMPKTRKTYQSDYLFPFFFNMLAEGANRKVQSRQLQISENDHFGLLLATSSKDSIGAIRVKEIVQNG